MTKIAHFKRVSAGLAIGLLVLASGCGSRDSDSAYPHAGPLRITGGGSAQFKEAGVVGNQDYGHEARRAELVQAAKDVHNYLAAYVEEDWPVACGYLSRDYRRQLAGEARQSREVPGSSCAAMIEAYTGSIYPAQRRASSTVLAGSLRVEGDTGYLFFNPVPGEKFLMTRDGDSWRIAANLSPTPAN